jgi:hypothetical protein
MIDAERPGPGYEAHLRRLVMKRARFLLVRARRKLRARPQGDAFELTGAVGLSNRDARGVVAVFLDNDSARPARESRAGLFLRRRLSNVRHANPKALMPSASAPQFCEA